MTRIGSALILLVALAPLTVLAQTQIGGGVCSSASLSGTYSVTLTGRDVSSTAVFSKALLGVGVMSFDGLSAVTMTIYNTSNQQSGLGQTFTGNYTMQANCIGTLNITAGNTASFTVESYNQGNNYLITGQDGTYSYTGSGSLMPTTSCSATILSGSYSFNGSGYVLNSGSISNVNNMSGLLQFNGQGSVTATWYAATNTAITTTIVTTGQYSLTSGCQASATVTDSAGNTYHLQLVVTAANGSNFLITVGGNQLLFVGAGRLEGTPTTPLVCSAATLQGTHSLVLTGRTVNPSAATLTGDTMGSGTASFDGIGSVTFTLISNTNKSQGVAQTLSGTYTLGSNCQGAVNLTSGDTATFTLFAYNSGKSFSVTGQDGTYALTGSGNAQPAACATSTFSGGYAMSGTGAALTSGAITGVNSISGILQFDGRGGITGNWSVAGTGSASSVTVSGQYSVTGCRAISTLTDGSGNSYALDFTATAADASDFGADIASLTSLFSTTGHSTFTNPGNSVVNSASFTASSTPPGSIFTIFGNGLATGIAQANTIPLPAKLLTTTVTVNGEAVPFFYVSQTQINAQMPLDVQPGVATVVVTNGTTTSNSAAVTVPATAAPGIFVYNSNRAVVQNPDLALNGPTAPARVGDTVVAYLTGGGPVTAAGALTTGHASPNGLSPVTENYTVTVGGVQAIGNYLGLTPTLVGVYQLDFVIPQVGSGDRNLIVTINGTPSNTAVMSVK